MLLAILCDSEFHLLTFLVPLYEAIGVLFKNSEFCYCCGYCFCMNSDPAVPSSSVYSCHGGLQPHLLLNF